MESIPLILKLDITGSPTSWINHEEAIRLYACDRVITSLGTESFIFRGGTNALTRQRSVIEVGSILYFLGRLRFPIVAGQVSGLITAPEGPGDIMDDLGRNGAEFGVNLV